MPIELAFDDATFVAERPADTRLGITLVCTGSELGGCEVELLYWLKAQPRIRLQTLLTAGKVQTVEPPLDAKARPLAARTFTALERIERRRLEHSKPHASFLQVHEPSCAELQQALESIDPDTSTVNTGSPTGQTDLFLVLGDTAVAHRFAAQAREGAIVIDPPVTGRTAERAFFDTLDQIDSLPFRILLLRPGAVHFEVLALGAIPNSRSFVMNQANLQRRALLQLQRVIGNMLRERRRTRREPRRETQKVFDCPPPMPSLGLQARYLLQRLGSSLRKRINRQLGREDLWRVGVMRGKWTQLRQQSFVTLPNPPASLLADPFVYHRNGRDYCFAEALDFRRPRGYIVAYEVGNQDAKLLGTALSEGFHLSFPFLFEYEGQLFMCPEAHESRQIRIYECTDFPLGWRLHSVIMEDVSAADSMLFEWGGRWWMLTNIDTTGISDHCSELHLFHADSPLSVLWTPHPMNPLVTDPEYGRNGGLLREGNRLYRVSQRQGFDSYGLGTAIHEIVSLDEEHYVERRIANISADIAPGAEGTHHLHSDGRLTAFDFRRQERYRES